MFTFPLRLPSGKSIRVPELTNGDILNLVKYCAFEDYEGFETFVNEKLFTGYEDISIIDKFYVLLFLRTIYIGEDINIGVNSDITNEVSVSLNDVLSKFESITLPDDELVVVDNVTIGVGLPTKLFFSTVDELYFDLIQTIKVDGETTNVRKMSKEHRDEIYGMLPARFMSGVVKFYTKLSTALGDITMLASNERVSFDGVNISLLSNQPIAFLKQLYAQDVTSFIEFMYHFVNKVGGTFDDFLKLNINDSKLIFNLYVNEIKKQNDELKSNKSM